jgi:hypothetical protein
MAYALTYDDFVVAGADLWPDGRARPHRDRGQGDPRRARPTRCCSMAATPGRARYTVAEDARQDMVDVMNALAWTR